MDNPFEGMADHFAHNRYTDELLRIADLNSDGLLDVWYIGPWNSCVYVRTMEHRIDSALIEHSGSEINPTHPFSDLDFKGEEAHVLDWNGDGLMDLVLSHADCNGLRVYQQFIHGHHGGPPEVCFSHRPEDGALRYFEGQSDGKLKQTLGIFEHIDPEPGSKYRISIVDWDGDGDLDLILASRSEKLHFYENKDGRLTDTSNESALAHIANLTLRYVEELPFLTSAISGVPSQPIAADWDGDGLMDLVLAPEGRFFKRLQDGSLQEWWGVLGLTVAPSCSLPIDSGHHFSERMCRDCTRLLVLVSPMCLVYHRTIILTQFKS